MGRRSVWFGVIASLASGLGVIAADPVSATPVISASFDVSTAHPGDTVTLDVTSTNPEAADVVFTFLSVNPIYDTITDGTRYSNTSCTGQISWCDGGALHYSVLIAPGATRTATLTYQIAADSPCGEGTGLAFYFYNYRESAAGAFDLISHSPTVTVLC